MTTESWHLKGEYFENCNCDVLCPCVIPGPPNDPTEGHCDVGFAFHIQEGNFKGVSLNDLNFVMIAYTPGNMGRGQLDHRCLHRRKSRWRATRGA